MVPNSNHWRQDSWYSWIVCISGTASSGVTVGLLLSFGVVYPVLLDQFKQSKDETAWVGSLGFALFFFSGPFTGTLINRFGCKTISLVGAMTCAASLILTSFSPNLVTMYFAYSLPFGLGTSFIFAPSLVMIGKFFDKRRALASGMFFSGSSLGIMCLGPVLNTLISAFGWRDAYRILSGVVLGIGLSVCVYDRNVPESLTQREEEVPLVHNDRGLNMIVWRNREFVKIALSVAIVNFGQFSPLLHLVLYCEDIGISSDLASKLYVYNGISEIFGKILFGRLCDVPGVNARYVCQAAGVSAGTVTILVTLSKDYVVLVAYVIVFGICMGGFVSALITVLLTCVPEQETASAIGWQMFLNSFFVASGPPLVGLMVHELGGYVPAFYMIGGVIIFGSLVPFLLQCVYRQKCCEGLHWNRSAIPRCRTEQCENCTESRGLVSEGRNCP